MNKIEGFQEEIQKKNKTKSKGNSHSMDTEGILEGKIGHTFYKLHSKYWGKGEMVG